MSKKNQNQGNADSTAQGGAESAPDIEDLCRERGLRMTGQRRLIARVLSDASDHPDVAEVHKRASEQDHNISLATVYRTVRLLENEGILKRIEFGDGRARYEEAPEHSHYHLIDTKSGDIIEFEDSRLDDLLQEVATGLGYRISDVRMDVLASPLPKKRRKGR